MLTCCDCAAHFDEAFDRCPVCGGEAAEHHCVHCDTLFQAGDACPACGALLHDVKCEAHPERAAEGRCVICGRAACALCRADDGRICLCAEHASVPVIQGWAQVYSTTSEFEAQLVRDNLRAEGITAQIYSQKDSAFSVDLGELSIVRILVPVWEYAQALQLIRERMDSEGEVAFACPACGEAYDTGARECASCGEQL
jgi:hypothetical protein